MKRGRGGDSVEAIKAVWMEGFREGQRRGGIPVVRISDEDLRAVCEPGHCAHPDQCPCSAGLKDGRTEA